MSIITHVCTPRNAPLNPLSFPPSSQQICNIGDCTGKYPDYECPADSVHTDVSPPGQ